MALPWWWSEIFDLTRERVTLVAVHQSGGYDILPREN